MWQELGTCIPDEIISTYQEHEITSLVKSCFSANHLEIIEIIAIFAFNPQAL
jgi:hypothetical protein